MSPDSKGSINPWDLSGERHEKPKWNDHGEYKTPFAAISSFLELWPGDEQTSECDIPERHLRLIEIVAGYPEILVGRRPLDMPLHPRSKLAFELSNFLDKIQSPGGKSEWHSLRSFLLHADLKDYSNPKVRLEDSHKKYIHVLIDGIRNGSEYDGCNEFNETLSDDEYQLLTVLHSKTKERVEKYWPFVEGKLVFEKLDNKIEFRVNSEDSDLKRKDNYTEHTFRLSKIHKWIKKWSDTKIIHPNAWQNLLIGTSAFLESIVAKMRSKILDEKRPGAIIVDGGGKITYLSNKSKEDEKEWMEKQLQNILMKEKGKGKRRTAHPFKKVIELSIKEYGKLCEPERQKYLRDQGQFFVENIYRKIKGEESSKDIVVPKEELFIEYIGPDVIKYFLPPISINKSEEDNSEWLFNQSIEALNGNAKDTPWQVRRCMICMDENDFQMKCVKCNKLTEHTKSGPTSYMCKVCNHSEKLLSSPSSIMTRSGFVCQFHSLIHAVGVMATIRQTSFLKSSGKHLQSSADLKIHYVMMFDGNSIGRIFTEPFKEWKGPDTNHEETTQIWEHYLEEITNLNESFNPSIELKERINSIDDEVEKGKIPSMLNNRRLQALIRKQRRSFAFNAGWWVSIASSIDGKGIIPWVVAGDDTVLASNSENENDIQELLTTFQNELQNQFPKVPISFAGSVQSRGDLTIQECYRKASDLEKIASNAWKHQIGIENDLLTEQKKKKLEDLEVGNPEEWNHVVESAKWASENGKLIGEKEVKSLILFDNWNNHSSS